jgi:hypothetical protein
MNILASTTVYGKEISGLFFDLSVATLVTILTTIVLLAFALRLGKDRAIALIIALYVGLLAFLNFPYLEQLILFEGSDAERALSNGLVFLGFAAIAFVIMERIVWAEYPRRGGGRFFEALLLALSATILLLSFAYHVLPIAAFYDFEPQIDLLFEPSKYFFWWLVAPLAVVFFLSRR